MRWVRGIVVLLLLLPFVSGCHAFRSASAKACHGPQPYQQAKNVPPLTIPSGMDAPDTTNALRMPALNEPAPPPRKGREPC
ncbi:MAG TPA: hypothetical protein VGH75_03595, partial [Steroidobacteraceae bacterium]